MNIVFLVISFYLGVFLGFVLHILLIFVSSQNEPEAFIENNHSDHYKP